MWDASFEVEASLSQSAAAIAHSRNGCLNHGMVMARYDFCQVLSVYFSAGPGTQFSACVAVWTIVTIAWTQCLLAMFDAEQVTKAMEIAPMANVQGVLVAVIVVISGSGSVLASVASARGLRAMLWEMVVMLFTGGPLYCMFHTNTKCHFFSGEMDDAAGAEAMIAKRGAAARASIDDCTTKSRSSFTTIFQRYVLSSHFNLGLEMFVILVFYTVYTKSIANGLVNTWLLWFSVVSWVFTPFWFNPRAFQVDALRINFGHWIEWMSASDRGSTGNSGSFTAVLPVCFSRHHFQLYVHFFC
jgi:callose synthase